MNTQAASSLRQPPPAVRPYTRAHNDLYDKIKPELYHRVDRSVLDALIRQLEGFHQSWVALTILQLARLAAVSPWSVTQALKRLESAGVILRHKKKLTQAGRFIWELALADNYRVAVPTPEGPMGSSHGTLTWDEPMPLKEKDIKITVPKEHHHGELAAPPNDDALQSLDDEGQSPINGQTGAEDRCELLAADLAASVGEIDEPEQAGGSPGTLADELLAAHPRFIRDHLRREEQPTAQAPETSKTSSQALRCLLSLGIDLWKARQLAQEHPLAQITQTIAALKYRTGTVRNPAAWVIRELERGGYAPPRSLAEQARRQAQQASKALQQRLEEEHQAEQSRAQQQKTAQLLDSYGQLPAERQEALLDQVRAQLRQVSPRLAAAPLDLTNPGPVRSQLLELLEGLELPCRTAGPTPRVGSWDHRRKAPEGVLRTCSTSLELSGGGITVLAPSVDTPC